MILDKVFNFSECFLNSKIEVIIIILPQRFGMGMESFTTSIVFIVQ